MKKLLGILVLGLMWCNTSLAETITGQPDTIDKAIEKFFKGRKLDLVEGIWYDEKEKAKYAIVKESSDIYEIWTVEHKISKYRGTKDTNMYLTKTSMNKVFSYSTTIYNPENISESTNGGGTAILINDNLIEYYIVSGCYSEGRCWTPMHFFKKRIWP